MMIIRAFYPNLVICSYMGGATERYTVKQNAPAKGAFVIYALAPRPGLKSGI